MIDLLGHMAPDERLQSQLGELRVTSPVGLSAGIDSNHVATAALSRFGFGFVELGPVAFEKTTSAKSTQLSAIDETLLFPEGLPATDTQHLAHTSDRTRCRASILARLLIPDTEHSEPNWQWVTETVSRLTGFVDGLTIEIESSNAGLSDAAVLTTLMRVVREAGLTGPVFLRLRNFSESEQRASVIRSVREAGLAGVILDGSISEPGSTAVRFGRENSAALVAAVNEFRCSDDDLTLIASGCIHEPADALRLLDAGADAVMIDSGLVFGGPGLAKRTNEAIVATRPRPIENAGPAVTAAIMTRQSWFWAMLLSLALLGGGSLALAIASTRVVLPYDETLVGMTIDELCGVNDRLLPFLTHDRVTLAGTMLADGILYFGLAVWGIRAGFHWARVTVLASSLIGFFSFFLFLGFGYFDPFHAFVTAVVFQFVLFTMYAECRPTPELNCPDLTNDRAWRRGLLGQLIFIVHGVAIAIGGLVICSYGVTTVFVQDDLDFMRTTASALQDANPQLVPMIAHDRASFGGMLVSCGAATTLSALWGFRRGAAWLWWSLLLSGTVAYSATIAVHIAVGYTSLRHLLPAYGGLAALLIGSALTSGWLRYREPRKN